jgi:tetratricopeptide (TPR) repeat protein
MNFVSYMKQEIEKLLFIEIGRDLVLSLKGNPVLKSGEYPVFPEDLVGLARQGGDGVPVNSMIEGMIHVLGCDPEFKYNESYKSFLSTIDGIDSYLIMNIEKYKEKMPKKALVYALTLTKLNPKREYRMNTIYLMMDLQGSTNQEFISDEIRRSLESLLEDYPDYGTPYYYLGEYYLNRDMDRAKIYLRKALNDPMTSNEAAILLERIGKVEDYDNAVELVKAGNGQDALNILIPYTEDNPNNLDAKYYAAVAYRQTQNYHKALVYLDELLEVAERAEVYSEIGINLAALGEVEAAIDYFKSALKITPDDSGIICNIAVCHLNLGDIEEAKKAFSLATRINPKDEIAREWLEKLA